MVPPKAAPYPGAGSLEPSCFALRVEAGGRSPQLERSRAVDGRGGRAAMADRTGKHAGEQGPLPCPEHTFRVPEGSSSVKLTLVLDIDNTLLHSAPVESPALPHCVPFMPEVQQFDLPIEHGLGGLKLKYQVKFRSGLASFLEKASAIFELAVYTNGSPAYTEQILRLIDPDKRYFGDRVCSRTPGQALKRLGLLVPPERQHLAVIVDDREDVWEEAARPCIVLVRPFYFFRVEQLPPQQPWTGMEDLLYTNPADDPQLHQVLHSALGKVHTEMYRTSPLPSVESAVRTVRMHVLQSVVLVFSGGIIPDARAAGLHGMWRLAEVRAPLPPSPPCRRAFMARRPTVAQAFGAECLLGWDERVTHVVSRRPNTSTVRTAEALGLHAVSPAWLLDCAFFFVRLPESRYSLSPVPAPAPALVLAPPIASVGLTATVQASLAPATDTLSTPLCDAVPAVASGPASETQESPQRAGDTAPDSFDPRLRSKAYSAVRVVQRIAPAVPAPPLAPSIPPPLGASTVSAVGATGTCAPSPAAQCPAQAPEMAGAACRSRSAQAGEEQVSLIPIDACHDALVDPRRKGATDPRQRPSDPRTAASGEQTRGGVDPELPPSKAMRMAPADPRRASSWADPACASAAPGAVETASVPQQPPQGIAMGIAS